MSNVFTLDDGTKEITIVNTLGDEICKLRIRAGDLSLLDRHDKLMKDFDKIVEPISNMDINADGTAGDGWAEMKKIERRLIKSLEDMFDTKDIRKIFAKRNPFSSIDGKFYIENVLAMITDIVEKTMGEEIRKSEERMKEYTEDIDAGTAT